MVSPSTFLGRIVGSEIILNFGVPFSRGAGKKVTTSKIHCFFNFDMGRKGILDIVDNVSIGRLSRDMVRSLSYIVKAQVFLIQKDYILTLRSTSKLPQVP